MANTAFLFPGQGSQSVGMGVELYESFPEARDLFDQADSILGFSLTEIMFGSGGDPEKEAERLKRTEFTQPALFTHSLAANAILSRREIRPDAGAGHSLGEYSALVAAQAISFEEGLRIVRKRGELMGKAGNSRSGTMAAIIGLEDASVEELCEGSSGDENIVVPANYNSDGQIVISGDRRAVERAVNNAMERGALKAVILPVSGAFHSPLMKYAQDGLSEALMSVRISKPAYPVYSNVNAEPTSDPDTIRDRLIAQLTAPVRWSQTLRAMYANGITEYIEVGPGKVLSGLVRRTLGREMKTSQAGLRSDFPEVYQSTI